MALATLKDVLLEAKAAFLAPAPTENLRPLHVSALVVLPQVFYGCSDSIAVLGLLIPAWLGESSVGITLNNFRSPVQQTGLLPLLTCTGLPRCATYITELRAAHATIPSSASPDYEPKRCTYNM